MSNGEMSKVRGGKTWLVVVLIVVLVGVLALSFLYYSSQKKVVDMLQLNALQAQRLEEFFVPGTGRKFTTGQYLLAILCGLLLGLQRQADVAGLREDTGALKALGLEGMPAQSSLSKFLSACSTHLAQQILDISRGLTRRLRSNYGSATIDLDGQVQVVRGEAERANYGYNRKRRGSKSYFVVLGVLAECRDILDAWILPGSSATRGSPRHGSVASGSRHAAAVSSNRG